MHGLPNTHLYNIAGTSNVDYGELHSLAAGRNASGGPAHHGHRVDPGNENNHLPPANAPATPHRSHEYLNRSPHRLRTISYPTPESSQRRPLFSPTQATVNPRAFTPTKASQPNVALVSGWEDLLSFSDQTDGGSIDELGVEQWLDGLGPEWLAQSDVVAPLAPMAQVPGVTGERLGVASPLSEGGRAATSHTASEKPLESAVASEKPASSRAVKQPSPSRGTEAANAKKGSESAASKKASTPARASARPRGKGSKSGPNRREQGASDAEIETMSDEVKAAAQLKPAKPGLTAEEKRAVVAYVTDERRWNGLKLKRNEYWQTLSLKFGGRVSVQTIDNYWQEGAWEKYKLCRQNLVKHTGGGDGDEDWYGDSISAGSDDSDAADEDSEDEDAAPKPRKRLVLQNTVTGKYKRPTLLKFLQSDAFTAIHKRAHDDSSVERKRPFDSATPVSDSEGSKENLRKRLKKSAKDDAHDTDEMLSEVFVQWKKRSAKQEQIQEKTLELTQRRDDRELQHLADQTAIERAKLKQNERTIEIQERQQALQMVKDPDPFIAEEGRRMLRQLAERNVAAPTGS